MLLLAGVGTLGSLVPLHLGVADVPEVTVGIVGSPYFFGLIAGSYYFHRLIRGVGHVHAFAALASSLSAATLVHPFMIAALP